MKFLIDAQLPPRLAEWIRKQGHEAVHVQNADLRDADDAQIRAYAARTGSILVTKDRDFVPVTQPAGTAVQILWIRTGNLTTSDLLMRIDKSWPQVIAYLSDGVMLVELR